VKAEIINKLKQVSLFESIKEDSSALEEFASMVELVHFKKGQNIIKEGDEGDQMFILFKGIVEICKDTLAKEMYTVVKLSAEQNAFFGELALIDNDRRSATVIASTDCDLLIINKENFLKFGDKNSRTGLLITRKISQILGSRLRRANQDMVTLYEALVGEIEEST
jgi:CRP/FNR family transcriptional regulator, cyclic AMP receptor protein